MNAFPFSLSSSTIPLIIVGISFTAVSAAPTHLIDEEPVAISRIDKGAILIDFGKAAYGNVRLMPTADAKGEVTVHYGEDLQDGRINRKPPGTVRYNLATVTLSGDKAIVANPPPDPRNTELISTRKFPHPPAILTPPEWGVVLPFRWVELEGWSGEISPDQIVRQTAYLVNWDDEAAHFESSDQLLNRIWDLCKYSIKATNVAGIYIDGDRERIPYEADAYLNQLSHYYTDSDKEMGRDSIDHLLLNGTWPTEWAPHMVFMVYLDYLHTGDLNWMAGRYNILKERMLFHRRGEDHLIFSEELDMSRHDIVDWPKGERDKYVFTPRNTVVNSFHIRTLQLMIKMAREVRAVDDLAQFELQLAASKKAFNETFLDKETGLYRDGIGTKHSSSHANFFPLAFGITPENLREKHVKWLAERGMTMSVYAAQYFLEALFENGADAEALALITADGDRSWKHMLDSGTTITWEAWDMKYKANQDWNHPWGAAPANLFPRYLLGAQPLTPGWDTARISPRIADLESAKGKVPTRHGPILIDWSQKDGFQMSLELPENILALVDLPLIKGSTQVLLNGKAVSATQEKERWVLDAPVTGKAQLEVK
ncbi:family 78 glycoside hydrolase catalytic domain [Roseibacillus persicicus]|uniref:family 78 glycoside hydrolase catalytic domain n=1 Tax=Roseibacillus persicicus TaxID=454148 RepID=UPI00280EE79D|nr:family 78 glycoside hydrolase catalytic domain [Roseibacillus persicicus]MDQ8188961.1 family 78 glycoside hydrolase catalytic domain [Roseibacillus persicicus]